MATVIDALFFEIGLKDAGLARDLNRARATLHQGVRNIAASISAPLMTALGGITTGAFVADFMEKSVAVEKLSEQLGVNSEKLQAWSNAAERAGGSAAGFQGALRSIKSQLNSFATLGNLEGARMFSMLGLPRGTDPLDVMERLAQRAETMNRKQFEGWAKKLGLDDDTIYFLRQGREEIDLLIKRQRELGFYTKEDAEISRRARNAFLDLGQALKVGGGMIARYVLPYLEKAADGVTDFAIELRKHEPFVMAFLTGVTASMTGLAIKTAAAFWPLTLVAGAIAGLALLWDDYVTHMEGGNAVLGETWDWLDKIGVNAEGLKQIFEKFKNELVAWGDVFSAIWDGLRAAIDDFFVWVEKKFKAFFDLPGVIEIKNLLDKIWEARPEEVKDVMEHTANFDWSGDIGDYILRANTPKPSLISSSNTSSTVTTSTHIDTINVNGVQDGGQFTRDMVRAAQAENNLNSATAMTGGVGFN